MSGDVPAYPREASEAGVEVDVPVEVIVDAAGRVVAARVLKRVGYGLDGAAERGVRGYRFAPARRAGRATAVRMTWTVQFRLH